MPIYHLKKISKIENKFLKEFISDFIKKKKFIKKKQNNAESYYWPRLNSNKDGQIDWNWTAEEIINFIKSFSKPFDGSFSYLDNTRIKILDASLIKSKLKFHSFQNGLIFRFHKNFFYIANRDSYIKILKKNLIGLKQNPNFYLGKRFSNK